MPRPATNDPGQSTPPYRAVEVVFPFGHLRLAQTARGEGATRAPVVAVVVDARDEAGVLGELAQVFGVHRKKVGSNVAKVRTALSELVAVLNLLAQPLLAATASVPKRAARL